MANYFLFLLAPIITNIIGFIAFTCNGDSESRKMINAPLIDKIVINEINNELENQEITKNDNGNNSLLNKDNYNNNSCKYEIKTKNYTVNKEGEAPPLLVNEIESLDNKENYKNLEIEKLNSQNKSLNLKIKSLQIKIKALEETNEKLTNKIAMLCEKYNINEDEEDLNNMNMKP